MTDLEISKALALAIGYLPEHVRDYGVGSINFNKGAGVIQVFCHDGAYGVDRTECNHLWNIFRYTDWNVISPIAERFDCFPARTNCYWKALHSGHLVYAYTPQKAIALAVIQGAKK
jgi:hypothetical protein